MKKAFFAKAGQMVAKDVVKAVLDGDIDPDLFSTKTFNLNQIDDAYQAMTDRQVIKSCLKVSD